MTVLSPARAWGKRWLHPTFESPRALARARVGETLELLMVKTEIPCPDCGGHITAVRELADDLGAAEIEAHHRPGCPALDGSGDTPQHEDEAQGVPAPSDAPQGRRVGAGQESGRLSRGPRRGQP